PHPVGVEPCLVVGRLLRQDGVAGSVRAQPAGHHVLGPAVTLVAERAAGQPFAPHRPQRGRDLVDDRCRELVVVHVAALRTISAATSSAKRVAPRSPRSMARRNIAPSRVSNKRSGAVSGSASPRSIADSTISRNALRVGSSVRSTRRSYTAGLRWYSLNSPGIAARAGASLRPSRTRWAHRRMSPPKVPVGVGYSLSPYGKMASSISSALVDQRR